MKRIFLLSVIFLIASASYGVYSKFFPITMSQPDGAILTCYITGDEYYRWLHDADGYTIIQDEASGYLVYARLENDRLISTNYVVGQIDPSTTELEPWLNISARQREEIRHTFIRNTPAKAKIQGYDAPKNKNEGVLNNLVIYIRFSDQSEFTKDTTHYWNMFNSMETPTTPSMRNFFLDMSYQMMDIPSHFFPLAESNIIVSYQDIYERSYYMPYNDVTNPNGYSEYNWWERTEREQRLLDRAINAIKAEVPASLDLDFNNDGYIDNICFIIKGEPTAWNTLLWPHKWTFFETNPSINGKNGGEYNVLLESHLDTYKSSVISHETFHTLSAPDLYRYSDNTIDPIGAWDLMCANANPPQSTAAYMKYKYGGWIDDIPEITKGGTYTIYPVWNQGQNIYKIASPNSSYEFFTVEYRTKYIYWDSGIPGSGLLIYRIDPRYDGNADGPPDEMYIFRPGASNSYTNGNLSQAAFSKNTGKTEFHNSTNPPCFLANGSPGNIHITNISAIGDSMTFEVVFPDVPEANFVSNLQNVQTGSSVSFFDRSSNLPTSWEWEFEGGTSQTSTEKNPIIAYETEGIFKVKLTATNEYGSGSIEKEAYIYVGDFPPIPDFEADNTEVIVGSTASFTDLSLNSPTSWTWEFEGGTPSTSDEQNPVITYETVGTFDVRLTVKNPVGEEHMIKENYINVVPPPLSPIANFEADKTIIDVNEEVHFTDLSENYPQYWEWYFEGGTPDMSEEQNPVVLYDTKGSYSVTLVVSSAYGMDTKVMRDYIIVGDVSIDNLIQKSENVLVYPNPNNGHFHLKTTDISPEGVVDILDMTGRLILTFPLTNSDMEIDLSDYQSGIYLINIKDKDSSHNIKIIKQ
ncbi:MAG: M6 family metalloprotease domain-containing protein [Bacteroidales bacterium]|jgi:M6 family metalloprotease-like protein|nr:M6 family metalloprotease domain-containing protein [Bacteroidales bacterium]